jgi:ABC-type antimicrobial peptide transport system permease subunit
VLRAVIADVDPAVPVSEVRTMDDVVGQSLAKPHFIMLLVGAFALVALLLGGFGVYGVMSYLVTQRTREIGVRLALGATIGGVVLMIVKRATWLAGAGAALGVVAMLLVGPALRPLLYGVSTSHAATLIGVPLLFVVVAVVASAAPARRAAGVDPASALRAD